jgi:outer membrane protein insertion porin family
VEITPSEGGQPGIMNLNVKVKEKLTGSISIGGGFSSDDGLFTSGEITQRNLFGRGQYLGLKAFLGQEAQRYVLSFTEPYLFDKSLSAGIDLYDWVREYEDFTKDATGFRLRTGFPFGNWSRLATWYTFEDANIYDLGKKKDVAPIIWDQKGRQIMSSVTEIFERDTTDNPFLPTRGSVNMASVQVASTYIGSDSDFAKYEVHSGWYYPLFWKFVGFVRGEVGFINQWDKKDHPVPLYERFFLGGINSLRGFQWGDVGPRQDGEVVGGTKFALGNVELLFPLVEKMGIRGVFFFDAGNAYGDRQSLDVMKFRTDAGAGIRWNSPLGPLRIEWGYNIEPRRNEDQYQWQFSAGAFF